LPLKYENRNAESSHAMSKPVVVAIITTDLRDDHRRHSEPEPSFGTAPTSLLQGLAGNADCVVHVISCVQKPVASPEKIAGNMFYHSVEVGKWGWMRGGYLGCILAVRKKLREIRPDIVHGQGTERYCSLSAVFSGFPNVITIHGNMRYVARVSKTPFLSFQWLAARLETFTIPRSGGVVCITNYTREGVRLTARHTWLVPNAVDKTFFEISREVPKKTVILCIGTICLWKNQNAFIRALDPLAKQTSFEVLFAGGLTRGDPYPEEFLSLVSSRPWCRYLGFGDRESVKNLLKSAAMLVLPTLEDNCPMVVLEAAAAGVPVVAAKVGGVPDLVEHGVTGLLFDPNDDAALRSAVMQIMDNQDTSQQMASRARQQALDRFHPDIIAGRHVEIYREVMVKNL
jgi:glycosyltransferase involved in cell wall biosynthesis